MDIEKREKQIEEIVEDGLNGLNEMSIGEKEYKNTVEAYAKLVEAEAKVQASLDDSRVNEARLELEKLKTATEISVTKQDNVRKWIDTGVSVVVSIGKLAIPVIMGILAMGFEKTDSMSYSAGKNALRDCWDNLRK